METITCNLAVELARHDHTVGITCLQSEGGPLALKLRDAGVEVRLVQCPGVRSNFLPYSLLKSHFANRSPDVVHAHNGVWAKAAVAARAAHVPAVVKTLHGFALGEPRYYDALRWWASRYTDYIVAVSEPLKRHLITSCKVASSKICLLPNGIDIVRFAPGRSDGYLRRRLGVSDTTPLVGCIARLDPVKNHAALISAFPRVSALCPDAHLVIVGDGPLRAELENQVHAMGLGDIVHFTGELADPVVIYRDLDVFALASIYEGTSISILEALATGVPVVATNVGGNFALLDSGGCGLLVGPNDSRALADAIASILLNPRLGEKLAAGGRAWVMSSYSLEAMVGKYESLYHDLVKT
ncbi:glycosyltransferase family 4 protein [Aminobacter anthyllidis]|uniref:Glycosyltransferase family 4 protein n=1 Tax=Aminobacter anthyllidis TaxID=1035067 RepID=A0A9X1AGR7_9HYPH|nr:glycosyltransferase family 4 protein [Aminobacter anthyllidis]MBT1159343.1 glycosyltransferase family 4 protein [Aminobacter anthyllidis]